MAACAAGRAPREQDRNSRAYRRFRDALLAMAAACEECGAVTDLVLHHRIRTRERPELLFDGENLEVLCRACHTRHHSLLCHHQPEVAA
jgi:5-methylcytosine-specific restriction endonuclease McrA